MHAEVVVCRWSTCCGKLVHNVWSRLGIQIHGGGQGLVFCHSFIGRMLLGCHLGQWHSCLGKNWQCGWHKHVHDGRKRLTLTSIWLRRHFWDTRRPCDWEINRNWTSLKSAMLSPWSRRREGLILGCQLSQPANAQLPITVTVIKTIPCQGVGSGGSHDGGFEFKVRVISSIAITRTWMLLSWTDQSDVRLWGGEPSEQVYFLPTSILPGRWPA